METKDILKKIREDNNLTQEEFAERVLVTFFNEDYCKWCYTDGAFVYETKDDLLDFLMDHMPNPEGLNDNDRRSQYDGLLSQLKHWYEG